MRTIQSPSTLGLSITGASEKCRQRETWWWWWCDEVEKAVETKKQKFKEWKKAKECEKDVKQAEYKTSRNEAKRCIARIQAETLDSKEGRQNIF